MKQIVLEAPGKFAERDAPLPGIPPGHALVRMERVGVCGSDFHAFAGTHPIYTYPRVLGHELSGVIVECPSNDQGLRLGDRCAIEPYLTCGHCRACRKNRRNCCENIQLFGIHIDGGLQEFLAVPLDLLHKSEQLSLEQLALVETLGIGAHAVERSRLQHEESVLIVGAGPVGLATTLFAQLAAAAIHIVETNPERRRFVEAMGHRVTQSADGRQADVVFDATGSSEAMASSLQLVAPAGRLVYVGLTKNPIQIDDSVLHRGEITVMASRNSFGMFPYIIQLIEKGIINPSHWVTTHLSMAEVASKFSTLSARPQIVKAMIDVSH
ncbi:MAG TPA: zinc-binding alcohol dehydrogenase family protein [Terriglobales bacterium]|nr:zinc-binding alcohol dehydrogenase family protein [Terriglobales bacterium]